MPNQCVVAVYDSFENAKVAIQALEKAKFTPDEVSFVTHSVEDEVPHDETLQYGDKTESNAAKGAGVGGLIGVLIGAPLVTVTGVGALLLAGPIATGLAGAIVGGFLGALSGWGVEKDHVSQYEQKVKEGAILVVANGTPRQVAEAQEILRETDAAEVNLHAETSADRVGP